MSVEDLRAIALFDGLTDSQLQELHEVGEDVSFGPGDELFRQARPAEAWWVLLDGSLDLIRRVGPEEILLAHLHTPGHWAGGFRAWDPHGVYLGTARGVSPGRVLRVPAEQLRKRADAWFPFGVHLISGLFGTVRTIESLTRQRESLVSLGTLAAGLAHEINNPASAATRAIDALQAADAASASALARLAVASVSPARFVALDALRRELDPQTDSGPPLAAADREDAVSDWLADRGVREGWLLAPSLAAAGADLAWCERVAALLDDDSLDAGLEWVAGSLSTAALLVEAKESTRRITELVAAVRSYAQLDRAALQSTDVAEGIEATLVVLGSRLHDGVQVVRNDDPDLPRIEAVAGELNQAWTNLITNAVEAISGSGILRVSVRRSEHGVLVEIADTGRGMSPDVLAHAFDPFFTTKDVGQGVGLGLDVARRIVEGHGGDIVIESEPGATVVRVRLPLRLPR